MADSHLTHSYMTKNSARFLTDLIRISVFLLVFSDAKLTRSLLEFLCDLLRLSSCTCSVLLCLQPEFRSKYIHQLLFITIIT